MIVKTIARIKRAWALSKLPNAVVFDESKLSDEQLETLKNSGGVVQLPQEPIGDGNAVFFGDPTEEEELQHKRELEGTDKWYKRIGKLL